MHSIRSFSKLFPVGLMSCSGNAAEDGRFPLVLSNNSLQPEVRRQDGLIGRSIRLNLDSFPSETDLGCELRHLGVVPFKDAV